MADPTALNEPSATPAPAGPPARFLTVLTTTDSEQKAERLARGAIEDRLAACAQISAPVTSVYRWDGAVETSREWQVLFKTVTGRYAALEAYLLAAHDYDTPEIIATPVTHGGAGYLAWVAEETS
ncbi:divalent-cation tolerance protein CutA [Streptomyces sp. RS10V-4]|uniref:divalent-cation tolerance protein CutA n=1 Tax=Streptomyces rhizoryzae TaxID=2932493 RepID=UPI0020053628|nr:divalent-cation tolerance protein CutA [Streptomyces rhizoryzae]MCK7627176.1 divalent-cation tolerance protein CutA [Streptomyces rhizoryzae]